MNVSTPRRRARIVLLTLLTGIPVVGLLNCSFATTYYVDVQSRSGSALGTAAHPFNSIVSAANVAVAGDTVVVRPGLYREAVHLKNSGTAAEPITFIARPAGKAIVTGADIVPNWTRIPGDAPIYSAPWNHVFAIDTKDGKPVEHYPDNAPVWGRAEQVICGSQQLAPVGSVADLALAYQQYRLTGVVPDPVPPLGPEFAGCFAVDTTAQLLYVCLVDGADPNERQMQASTRDQLFGVNQWESATGVQHVIVSGFVFRYGATFSQRAAVNLFGKNNAATDCIVESMAGSGLSVCGAITSCIIRDCGQTGNGPQGDDFVAENCIWCDNCWKPIDRGWDAGGVKITNTSGGLFKNCLFARNGGPGLWFDIDMHDTRVTQCVFEDNESAGFFNEISRNNTIDHNLFIRNGLGGNFSSGMASAGIAFGESEDCIVSNNTIVVNSSGISIREQGPRPTAELDGDVIQYHDKGIAIHNNIIADNASYQLQFAWDNYFFGRHPGEVQKYPTESAYDAFLKTIPDRVFDPAKQDFVIDENIYFAGANQGFVLYGVQWRPKHKTFSDLPEWTSLAGWDTDSALADPEFVSLSTNDFRVKKNGPASKLNAGWAGVPADIDQWERSLVSPWQRCGLE